MTKKIITSYAAFLAIALVLSGAPSAYASEVTGTLSSDNDNVSTVPSTGNISGTVSGSGGVSSSGGSRSSGNRGSSSNAPTGSVLGAATNSLQAPGFPNAGVAPQEAPASMTPWSALVAFFTSIISF